MTEIPFNRGAVQPTESVRDGWNLIKDDYWLFFGMTLVAALIIFAISFVLNLIIGSIAGAISLGIGVASQNAGDIQKASASIVPQLISQVLGIFTGLITTTLYAMLYCGVITAMSRKAHGGVPAFGDLFQGFNYFKECLTVSLILTLIQFALSVVFLIIGAIFGISALGAGLLTRSGKFDPNMIGAILGVGLIFVLIMLVINVIIAALTAFVYPLITERKLSGIQALALSAKAATSNMLGLILLLIIQFFIALAGAFVCGIGIFFVMPILAAGIYAAYLMVFGRTPYGSPNMPPPPNAYGNTYGNPNYGGI